MEKLQEIWKPIKGYEGLYEVSNMGRVKSLARKYCRNDRVLRGTTGNHGYNKVGLYKNSHIKTILIQYLVWDAFGNGRRNGWKQVIDHVDSNKLNNNIDNLQLLTQRENISKSCRERRTLSKYTGVSWHKNRNTWVASISLGGKQKHLGCFDSEKEASIAYSNALNDNI